MEYVQRTATEKQKTDQHIAIIEQQRKYIHTHKLAFKPHTYTINLLHLCSNVCVCVCVCVCLYVQV